MNELASTSRRRFLAIAGGAAVLVPALPLVRTESANAAETPRMLDESDPTAAALGYRKDTAQVDAARYPQHQLTQVCSGCRYFQAKAGSEWGPCAIFAGKGAVHSRGWCAAYAAR